MYTKTQLSPTHTHTHAYEYSGWPAGWKVSFSHWELCQFSFHYSTWGLNPYYHNKLYFYRYVQTEAAFQGIRLNFTWPPVFSGNTTLPQLPPTSPQFFFFFFFKRGCIWNMLLTEYHISTDIVYCFAKAGWINSICFSGGFQCSSYCAVNWILSHSVYTHHAGFHMNLPKGTCQRLLYQIIRKTCMEICIRCLIRTVHLATSLLLP